MVREGVNGNPSRLHCIRIFQIYDRVLSERANKGCKRAFRLFLFEAKGNLIQKSQSSDPLYEFFEVPPTETEIQNVNQDWGEAKGQDVSGCQIPIRQCNTRGDTTDLWNLRSNRVKDSIYAVTGELKQGRGAP